MSTLQRGPKKRIFYSHASEDKGIVNRLETLIGRIFQRYFESYNSSNLGNPAGAFWRKNILENIKTSEIVIVLLTPTSQRKHWVMYEAGACWLAAEANEKTVIPCLYGLETLPSVLSEHQGVSLLAVEGVQSLIEKLKALAPVFPDPTSISNRIRRYVENELKSNSYKNVSDDPVTDAVLEALAKYFVAKNDRALGGQIANFLRTQATITDKQRDKLLSDLSK